MRSMRGNGGATPVIIAGTFASALASACAAKPSPVATAPSAAPPAPSGGPAIADGGLIAANAGLYAAFRAPSSRTPDDQTPVEVDGLRWPSMSSVLGIDFVDAATNDMLGVDTERPIVLSNAIVDPARLGALLSSPEAPPNDAPFVVESIVVVPVVDPARAQAVLGQVMSAHDCARPRVDRQAWSAWLATLKSAADRRAAEATDAVYLCVTGISAIAVRVDANRRELSWVGAGGTGNVLAVALETRASDPVLSARLQAEGFFSARRALFLTRTGDVRTLTATGLIKHRAGVAGIEPGYRGQIWRRGVQELGELQRLADSPPVLLEGMLVRDGIFTWTLTADGRTFFSSLGIGAGTTVGNFKTRIAAKLTPAGAFGDPQLLDRTQHEAGPMAPFLVLHSLWPHAIAFAAAHPGVGPAFETFLGDDTARIELDVERSRLRMITAAAPR
jgi:hypothetical protein